MTPIYVIARSKATWQSTHPLSLRGAKRRGNLFFRWCKTQDGLLRLRLAMTVGWLAMIRVLVIARSKATWQSIFQVVQDSRWIASPSARNDGGRLAVTEGVACSAPDSSHCEEHSDVAIHTNHVIARSVATWQSTHPLSLRGAKRRGNPPTPCHCEERSDVAIYFSGGARRKLDCFAFGSQ